LAIRMLESSGSAVASGAAVPFCSFAASGLVAFSTVPLILNSISKGALLSIFVPLSRHTTAPLRA